MVQGSSVLGRYGYDSEGLRILKIGNDGLRRYTYDQLSVITEANEANGTVSKYDYGLDQLVSLDNIVEGRSFFHLDVLRSTVNLTEQSGETRQSILYNAWGRERSSVGTSANNFTYTGHERDVETGLVYAKLRFYDPDIGRFLNIDPLPGSVDRPPTLHRYFYAFSNPTTFFDPDGRLSKAAQDALNAEIDRLHKATGAPKWQIALKLGGELSATGLKEQLFTEANIFSLGGAGGVRRGIEEGRINATQPFSESVQETLVAYGGGFIEAIPGVSAFLDSLTEGKTGDEVALDVGEDVLAVEEIQTILDSNESFDERTAAGEQAFFKLLRLLPAGRSTKNLIKGKTRPRVVNEGIVDNRGTLISVKGSRTPQSAPPLPPKNQSPRGRVEQQRALPFEGKSNIEIVPNRHNANVRVRRDGKTIHKERKVSGDMTAEEKALGFPKSSNAAHTEARAMRELDLRAGDEVIITGQQAPCPTCKGAMNRTARESGATITYQWRENGVTHRWRANSAGRAAKN